MEMYGRRKNGELFPLEACFSCWPGTDGLNYGAIFGTLQFASVKPHVSVILRSMTTFRLANCHSLVTHLIEKISEAKPGSDEITSSLSVSTVLSSLSICLAMPMAIKFFARSRSASPISNRATLVARLDGDEFAMVVEGANAAATAEDLSRQICQTISESKLDPSTRANNPLR